MQTTGPLADFLAELSKLGRETSVTGKWAPTKQGGMFGKSAESKDMLKEWEDVHGAAYPLSHEAKLPWILASRS